MNKFQNRSRLHRSFAAHQQGVALVIGMIFLVMLSLTGLVAMNRTILQERMTGAYRSEQLAYAAAEAGLRTAEWNLWIYPVVNNLTYPKRSIPEGAGDCSDVCASEAAYDPGRVTLLHTFRRAEPSVGLTMTTAGQGINANTDFLAGSGEGSRTAQAPITVTEYINSTGPVESFGVGGPGIQGFLRYYRITSRGFGPTLDIERQLQSTYTLVE